MSSHNHTREVVQTDGSSDSVGLATEERLTHHQAVFDRPQGLCQATIDDLPDDALLEIFDFYLDDKNPNDMYSADKWHTLVHVCRWWRSVVFSSPRRLDLRLLCTGDRSGTAMLDIWPALPIEIYYDRDGEAQDMGPKTWQKNMIAALEHPDRVRHINIIGFPRGWDALAGAMQVPFPELTYLQLWACLSLSALPGGFAPSLRTLELKDIPFFAVRNLIMSAGDLVDLTLFRSGYDSPEYDSPESMVACLSSLKRLESLSLEIDWFETRTFRPSPPPQARTVFPALAKFTFNGQSAYLGDFLVRIDTPMLTRLGLSLDCDLHCVNDIPHLRQFIGRARGLKPPKAARVSFDSWTIRLECPPCNSELGIVWDNIGWDGSSIPLVCGQLSPFFSLVERLDLVTTRSPLRVQDNIEATLFLELFRPLTSIQGLYVHKKLVPFIALALQELTGDGATEVLPNLSDLFLGGSVIPGSVQEAIQPFLDARRLSGRPIAIHRPKKEKADG